MSEQPFAEKISVGDEGTISSTESDSTVTFSSDPVSVKDSSTEGTQRFTPARARHEREVAQDAYIRHEDSKDRELHRHISEVGLLSSYGCHHGRSHRRLCHCSRSRQCYYS